MLDVLRHHGKFNFPLAKPILFYMLLLYNCCERYLQLHYSRIELWSCGCRIKNSILLLTSLFFPLQKIISIIQINFEQKRRNYPRNNYNIIVTNKIEYNRFPLFSPQNGTRVFIRGTRQKIQEQTNPAKHSSGECNEALVRFQLVDIDSRNLVEEQTCPFHSFV